MQQFQLDHEVSYCPTQPSIATSLSENRIIKMLEKHPLGLTLPEMAGGARQLKKMKNLRPLLTEAIQHNMVMPISQRTGHTVYRLVKYLKYR